VRHSAAGDCPVVELAGALVDDGVQVRAAARVVAGKLGGKLGDTIGVGGLDAAQSRVVQVARVGVVAVVLGVDTVQQLVLAITPPLALFL
jgi:hypothetical protein